VIASPASGTNKVKTAALRELAGRRLAVER
jgi:hypothetical protein